MYLTTLVSNPKLDLTTSDNLFDWFNCDIGMCVTLCLFIVIATGFFFNLFVCNFSFSFSLYNTIDVIACLTFSLLIADYFSQIVSSRGGNSRLL